MVICEGMDAVWRANGGQMAWIKNTADCVPAEIDPAALLLSSPSSPSHIHTPSRPKLHLHGLKIETPTWVTERQKRDIWEQVFTKDKLPSSAEKKEARQDKGEVSPVIPTLPLPSSLNSTESEASQWHTQTSPPQWKNTASQVCSAESFDRSYPIIYFSKYTLNDSNCMFLLLKLCLLKKYKDLSHAHVCIWLHDISSLQLEIDFSWQLK